MNEEKQFRFLQLLFENEKERDQYYGMELKKEAPDYLDFDNFTLGICRALWWSEKTSYPELSN